MDQIEFETPRLLDGEGPLAGSLVDLIVAASDTSEDAWEIGERLDRVLRSGRVALARRL